MKRLFLFLTVAAAVCCAACSDDPEVAESNLSLLEDNVTFDMFGGRSVLEITADSPWTVSCDDDWCRTNVAEGSHTKKIVLTVDQSFLPEERTTAVRFYAAGEEKHTVTVTQEKFEPILLAENGADITVYGAGSEPALNLRASVAWKIEGATDWCAVSQSEGTKSSVVKLLLTDDGEGVRPRSATLTVSSEMEGVEPQQVTVVQRSTGANTVVVRAGETRAFPARRTDGAYVKGVAADWVWTTDAELLSGLDYDASRNEITCTAAKSKQGSGLVALKGGYVLEDCEGTPDVLLIASGSEVEQCVGAKAKLAEEGIKARVISMPCFEEFEKQSAEYKESVMPAAVRARVCVEAASPYSWYKYAGDCGEIIGMTTFGASGPANKLFEMFGFTAENVVEKAFRSINKI